MQTGGFKMADGVWKEVYPKVIGSSNKLLQNKIYKKGSWQRKWENKIGGKWKIMTKPVGPTPYSKFNVKQMFSPNKILGEAIFCPEHLFGKKRF